jgi:hypothetical protein
VENASIPEARGELMIRRIEKARKEAHYAAYVVLGIGVVMLLASVYVIVTSGSVIRNIASSPSGSSDAALASALKHLIYEVGPGFSVAIILCAFAVLRYLRLETCERGCRSRSEV